MDVYVGIDVSKDRLDVAIRSSGEAFDSGAQVWFIDGSRTVSAWSFRLGL